MGKTAVNRTAAEAVSSVKSGQRIFFQGAAMNP